MRKLWSDWTIFIREFFTSSRWRHDDAALKRLQTACEAAKDEMVWKRKEIHTQWRCYFTIHSTAIKSTRNIFNQVFVVSLFLSQIFLRKKTVKRKRFCVTDCIFSIYILADSLLLVLFKVWRIVLNVCIL